MDPDSFEEDIGSIFRCDILLAGCEYGHLQKLINDQNTKSFPFLVDGRPDM
jgi:hypothetical protein